VEDKNKPWPELKNDYKNLNDLISTVSDSTPHAKLGKVRAMWDKSDWSEFNRKEQLKLRVEDSGCRLLELLWQRHPDNQSYNPNSSDLSPLRNVYKGLPAGQLKKDSMELLWARTLYNCNSSTLAAIDRIQKFSLDISKRDED
jgi:hypothetical protein